MGNTPFILQNLECDIEPGVIFPISEINAVRRQLTEHLEKARLLRFQRKLPKDAQRREKEYWSELRDASKEERS